jgi:hypothetical protein
MQKSKSSFITVVRHFHALLALTTGTIFAALLIPLGLRLLMTVPAVEDASTSQIFQLFSSLSFTESALLCLIPCAILNMPFAYAAYRRGREEMGVTRQV